MRRLLLSSLCALALSACDPSPHAYFTIYHIVIANQGGAPAYMIQQCDYMDNHLDGCKLYGYRRPVTPEGLADITEIYNYFAHPVTPQVLEVVK